MSRLLVILLIAASLIGCRSVKKVSETSYTSTDSVTYTKTETVKIDTVRIAADTATFATDFNFESGQVVIQEVTTDQGDDITISYEVKKKPGGASLKVTAVTKPKEVLQVERTVEIERETVKAEQVVQVETKRTRTGILVHLWWIIPLAVVGYIVYKKWPLIKAFIGL